MASVKLAAPGSLNIFADTPMQMAIAGELVSEHRPISSINSQSLVTFIINTPIDEYVLLNETLLNMRIRINIKKKDGTNVAAADWTKICPVNNLLHSLFKQVDVELNGKSISISPQTYAYKAMFETIVGFTNDAKKSHLTGALFIDDGTEKEAINTKRSTFITPSTLSTDGTGKQIDLIGKLHVDFAMQGRALLGGTSIKITLVPHEPTFYLQCENTITPSVEFIDAALYIHRAKVTPLIVEAHALALKKSNAKYPISRSEVKIFTINRGVVGTTIDNIVLGQTPRRALLAFNTDKAVSGAYTKNPFNFQHFDLNYLAAYMDGTQFPSKPYAPDFTNGLYAREYMGLFEGLNQINTDSVIHLSRSEWASGNTIFAFNFSPDTSDGANISGHVNPIKRGALRLQVRFKTALVETVNAILYLEYDNNIEITRNGEVTTDFI